MWDQIKEIKYLFLSLQISHEEAVQKLKPLVEAYNLKSSEIAKKYNRRVKALSVVGLLR